MKRILKIEIMILLLLATCALGSVRRVPSDYPTIQVAIDDCNDGDTVLVAPGTYTGDGNRDIKFKGKAITVKSEEGPQTCIIDCQGSPEENHHGFSFGGRFYKEDANSILQGFTIINGYVYSGGGISCDRASPLIIGCIIKDNTAISTGGGIYGIDSNLALLNCIIFNNTARSGGGVSVSRRDSLPIFINCFVTGNKAIENGGGIYCATHIELLNCTIFGNWAGIRGGGIYFSTVAGTQIINSILYGNMASTGSEIAIITPLPGAGGCGGKSFKITNSIVGSDPNAIYFTYCDGYLYGEWLYTDPLFAHPGYWADINDLNIIVEPDDPNAVWVDGDYHLKSQGGRWDPVSQSWIRDDVTSPCIDAGDPNTPVGDEPEPNGGRINMGAYGGTAEASKSYILAKIIYVDDDATGLNDGSSWENAYIYLQDALADANSAEKPLEIRIAQGVYKPDQGIDITPGDKGAAFRLMNGVTLKGGFAGLSEPDPNERDVELYETILSGDLNGDDVDINDLSDLLDDSTRYENSSIVIKGSGVDMTAVLDGFTITGGFIWVISSGTRGIGGSPAGGAGMLIFSGSPTLIDCTFTDNVTGNSGGGLQIDNCNSTMINCKFTRNYAGSGGGIFSYGSNPTLTNCKFNDNFADYRGGGMFSAGGYPKLTNCVFRHNFTSQPRYGNRTKGGGMYSINSSPVLTNCSFIENTAQTGGAIYNKDSNSVLNNCEFIGNTASAVAGAINNSGQLVVEGCIFEKNYPGAINDYSKIGSTFTDCTFSGNSTPYLGGAVDTDNAIFTRCVFAGNRSIGDHPAAGAVFNSYKTVFTNCTFVNNWAEYGSSIYGLGIVHVNNCILRGFGNQIHVYYVGEPIFVNYSNIKGGWEEGEGNIDADPLFADPGYWADADDPNIVAEPNDPNAIWIDGDYHLKSQAGRWDPNSGSWVIDDVTSPCIDAGDPNTPIGYEHFPNGGIINMGAYGGTAEASKSYFGEPLCETIITGDINGDCKVDLKDFMLLAAHWLEDRN